MSDECDALLPTLGGFISLIFSLSGGLWCKLVTIPPNLGYVSVNNTQPRELANLPGVNLGLWRRQSLDYTGSVVDASTQTVVLSLSSACVRYAADVRPDQPWATAQALQVLAWALAAALSLLLATTLCGCQLPRGAVRLVGVLFLAGCTLLQGLAFLLLQSDLCGPGAAGIDDTLATLQALGVYQSSCSIGRGGVIICLAVVGYFFTGISCLLMGRTKD